MFNQVDPKSKPSDREKKMVSFWKKIKAFEKSIESRREGPVFSFFDGPPFITGVPHYGTLLSSIAKDVVPRYWTMKGYRVDRRWGWDCHGLPAEHLVEKKLGIKSKKEIEEKVGIEKFNKECFNTTSKIAESWEYFIDRIGRWIDYKNAYRTMDASYMESVWWAFKELYDKELIYKDTRISLYCPRCCTPLANFEIAMDNSYKDVEDFAIHIRFELSNSAKKELGIKEKVSFLSWTTTPWTLLSNTGLAVSKSIKYVLVSLQGKKKEYIILSQAGWKRLKEEKDLKGKVTKTFTGKELIGLKYERLWKEEIFSLLPLSDKEEGWKIIEGDFVSEEEGSGIVHLSPAFGEEDYEAGKKENLPIILNVDEEGKFASGKFKGKKVWDSNEAIIKDLEKEGIVLAKEKVTHSYPFCHRCHTKLIYKVQPAWFVKVSSLREKLIAANEEINWHPEYLKKGRFLKGLESAPEWNISRDRYWGTPIPVWECEDCGERTVVGSYEELYKLSGQRLDDYHRPHVDKVTFQCPKCESKCKRIPQVLDSWIESGSMPFAERHYPFENQEDFNQKFPADFISEYIGQTRAWFGALHTLAVGLFGKPAFKNVVTTGVIAGEDGKKMSKSLGNYADPKEILENYSADALRFYLMSSPIMEGENISFSKDKVEEIQKGILRALFNSYYFFITYARLDKWKPGKDLPLYFSDPKSFRDAWQKPKTIIDQWILSELHLLVKEMNDLMDSYQIAKAARLIPPFVDKLSNWYIRRSRKRFWKSENDEDKNEAYQTLYEVLLKLSQVSAPFIPFITEEIYQNIKLDEKKEEEKFEEQKDKGVLEQDSIHLTKFPEGNMMLVDEELNKSMEKVRRVVTLGLSCRAKKGVKVRQPLKTLYVTEKENVSEELWNLVKEELNVKEVKEKKNLKNLVEKNKLPKDTVGMTEGEESVALTTKIDKELELEGEMREIVRLIQEGRKKANFNIEDRIELGYKGREEVFNRFGYEIAREVLADKMYNKKIRGSEYTFDKKVGKGKLIISLKRVKKS